MNKLQTAYKVAEFSYTGHVQTITLTRGNYLFECWGASGADFTNSNLISGGNGSYVFGKIRIDSPRKFSINVGQAGERALMFPPFNGGGFSGYAGGGASDIRLISGTNFESLKSRIIVAAGGSGSAR